MADLLLLTPLTPYSSGQGSAMRVGVALELLARRHRVYVLNTGAWGAPPSRESFVRQFAAGYGFLPDIEKPGVQRRVLEAAFGPRTFESIYAFRLEVAPLAVQIQAALGHPRPRMILDLDDDEVLRAQRFQKLREDSGDARRAAVDAAQVRRLEVFAKLLISRFDRILLAAERDRCRLQSSFPLQQFVHLPNVVRLPAAARASGVKGCLLFVGVLDYFPNEDGVVYFCEEILPLLRASETQCFVRVVGGGASTRIKELARHADVQVTGYVLDLAPQYEAAQVAIVPLRAGSGTRIKILESISYGRPVVSTSAGAEGLGLRHDQEILLADTPEEFAAAVRRLLGDGELRARLARTALEWLSRHHSLHNAGSVLDAVFDGEQG